MSCITLLSYICHVIRCHYMYAVYYYVITYKSCITLLSHICHVNYVITYMSCITILLHICHVILCHYICHVLLYYHICVITYMPLGCCIYIITYITTLLYIFWCILMYQYLSISINTLSIFMYRDWYICIEIDT